MTRRAYFLCSIRVIRGQGGASQIFQKLRPGWPTRFLAASACIVRTFIEFWQSFSNLRLSFDIAHRDGSFGYTNTLIASLGAKFD